MRWRAGVPDRGPQYVDLPHLTASPRRPARGLTRLFAKLADGLLYGLEPDGTETAMGGGAGGGYDEGTAFPGGPATNAKFYRTDLNLLFYFDGTRWLSTQLFSDMVDEQSSMQDLPLQNTAGSFALSLWANDLGTDIYLVKAYVGFYVDGGTALSASHKWVLTAIKNPGGASIGTLVSIDSGASSAWRSISGAINALVTTSTYFLLGFTWTKTGTPGNLYHFVRISYRIVAT